MKKNEEPTVPTACRSLCRAARGVVVLSVMLFSVLASPAIVMAQGMDEEGPSPRELLQDFNHFVFIMQPELAEANARALLAMEMEPVEFVGLVEDSGELQRFDEAYRRALRVPGLEPVAAELWGLYESGKRARARSPQEVDRNIELLLSGGLRGRSLARERLLEAGEYAVPQLLEAMLQPNRPALRGLVIPILDSMGRAAVVPLSEAVMALDPASQEQVIRVLGALEHPESVPYLYEVIETTQSPQVRSAGIAAVEQIMGEYDPQLPVGTLYEQLGERYWSDRNTRSLMSFPGEKHQLLWNYFPGIGLEPTAIYTDLYHEAMAMRQAERAMKLNDANRRALSLWLTSNFSRERKQPEGYDNPAYGPDRRDAMYYAVASGVEPLQQGLSRSLRDRETALARDFIEAIRQTAGRQGLVGGQQGEGALAAALVYPDRRVQYDAALAIAQALPQEQFSGIERVVPVLASLIRDAGTRYAVVIAPTPDRQADIRSVLEADGYTVLAPATSLDGAQDAIATVPGVDLFVLDLARGEAERTATEIRRSNRFAASAVLLLLSGAEVASAETRYADDHLVRVTSRGANDEQLSEAVRQLYVRAIGERMTVEEAQVYSERALTALRGVAIDDGVLRIEDAAVPLVAALDETSDETRMRVAEVLTYIGTRRAQSALMDAALEATNDERIELLDATAQSARRFGNLIEQRQIIRLKEIAMDGGEREATAAAALMGALSLPNNELVPLIVSDT